MNPYLKRLREQYEGLRSGMEGLQTRAATENRDLTETELRSVQEQGKQAETLFKQITELTEIETRNAQVAQMAGQIASATTHEPTGMRVGGASTQDRDPGHYRSEQDGGQYSFFGDMHRKAQGDEGAAQRLAEHMRALSTSANGPGIIPPKWLTSEYEDIARQGRYLANAVRRIPLGNDPRAITLPKQTAGTDNVVAEQSSENGDILWTDAFDTDVVTVTPKATGGGQIVSRQLLDASTPAVDSLIYADLMSVYNLQVEKKVGGAILLAGSAVTGSATAFSNMGTANTNGIDLLINAALGVRSARKLPADLVAMEVATWGRFKKLKDTTGRPVVPAGSAGPMNVFGVGSVAAEGNLEGLAAVVSEGMDDGTANQETFAVLRASDVLLFESNTARFRYEEPLGPVSVKIGIWGYTAVYVRYGSTVRRVQINTAA